MAEGPLTPRERAFIRDVEARTGKLGQLLGPLITLEVIREGVSHPRGTAEYEEAVRTTAEHVRCMRALNRDLAVAAPGTKTRVPIDLGDCESERQWALSAVAWRLAETAPQTAAFRAERLPDGLLDPAQVDRWRDDQGIDSPSLLDLRRCARALQRIGGWTREQAEDFILTGRTPVIDTFLADVRLGLGTILPTSRIVLTIDPAIPADLVARTYERLRKQLLAGVRQRPVHIRNLKIAAFIAHTPNMTRSKRVSLWNSHNRDDRWSGDQRSFANVYTQVVKHLTRRGPDTQTIRAGIEAIDTAIDRRRTQQRRDRTRR